MAAIGAMLEERRAALDEFGRSRPRAAIAAWYLLSTEGPAAVRIWSTSFSAVKTGPVDLELPPAEGNADMNSIRTLVSRYPLIAFFAMAYILTWLGWTLPERIYTGTVLSGALASLFLLMVPGPLYAALIVTALTQASRASSRSSRSSPSGGWGGDGLRSPCSWRR